jgi:acetyltransferase-like isoleucine patch superfamily enzyme
MLSRIRKIASLFPELWRMVVFYLPGAVGYDLRRRYWKTRLKHLGEGVIIEPGVLFQGPEHIWIGDHTWIDRGVILLAGIDTSGREKIVLDNPRFEGEPGVIHIGEFVHIAPHCIISGISAGVYISDRCNVAAGSKIYAFSHHYQSRKDPRNRGIYFGPMVAEDEQCLILGPVQLGRNTGVALNAVILPGVFIPEDCFVSIGSVVSRREYRGNSIIGGNPAESGRNRYTVDE